MDAYQDIMKRIARTISIVDRAAATVTFLLQWLAQGWINVCQQFASIVWCLED